MGAAASIRLDMLGVDAARWKELSTPPPLESPMMAAASRSRGPLVSTLQNVDERIDLYPNPV